ncbi:hypothetical protein AVEN_2757-1 [Araneus ventricosus]|uniref:Uncharacterized protein n=1 Tax=Araneus ventricosus TaxID=182803 RepID=A0A4Y2I1W1_ARAVE|nr:hypothetical protein AVEN_2757-1 [Araneus ventricosus]
MSYIYITFPSLQELEQQEVQNLLTTLDPIHDVQLQLVGYKQEKDDIGKKISLNICRTTPKRIKSIYDKSNDSISTDNSLESDESHKITQQLSRSDSIQDIKMKLKNIQRAVQEHLHFVMFCEQDLFYIGKVKKIEGEDILIKFLEKARVISTGQKEIKRKDSRTAAKIDPAKVATWMVGKTPKENSPEELLFTPYLVTLGTQNLFGNSQLRRSDGCPFSVELRRDYP